MISILVPSRGRPHLLQRFLQSVSDCAQHMVQVVVRLDDDDAENYEVILCPKLVSLDYIVGDEGAGMGRMTNECLRKAYGEIIMLGGDDLVIRTPGFDEIAAEAMPGDGIGLVYGDDLLQGIRLATHPFIGRAAINCWGGKVVPDEYRAEYIDTHIMDTFCRLERLGYQRVLYVPFLITEHMHHLNGKARMDATYEKPMDFRASSMIYERLSGNREADAQAMKLRIEGAA